MRPECAICGELATQWLGSARAYLDFCDAHFESVVKDLNASIKRHKHEHEMSKVLNTKGGSDEPSPN